jgi:hypothetical protein
VYFSTSLVSLSFKGSSWEILGIPRHIGNLCTQWIVGLWVLSFWTKSVQVPVVTFKNLMATVHDTFIRHLKQSETGRTENP